MEDKIDRIEKELNIDLFYKYDSSYIEKQILKTEKQSGFTLMKSQKEHLLRMIQIIKHSDHVFDSSMMGLGKTVMALFLCKIFKSPVSIIAPLSTHVRWIDYCKKFGLELKSIIGYERLISSSNYMVNKTEGQSKIYEANELFKRQIREKGVFLIFDECHKLKNSTGQSFVSSIITETLRQNSTILNPSKILLLSGTLIDKDEKITYYGRVLGLCSNDLNGKQNADDTKKKQIRDIEMVMNIIKKDIDRALFSLKSCSDGSYSVNDIYTITNKMNQKMTKIKEIFIIKLCECIKEKDFTKEFKQDVFRFMDRVRKKSQNMSYDNFINKTRILFKKNENMSKELIDELEKREIYVLNDTEKGSKIISNIQINRTSLIKMFLSISREDAYDFCEMDSINESEMLRTILNEFYDDRETVNSNYIDELKHKIKSMKISPQDLTNLFFICIYQKIYSECDIPENYRIVGRNVFYPIKDEEKRNQYRILYRELIESKNKKEGVVTRNYTDIMKDMQVHKIDILSELIQIKVKMDIKNKTRNKYIICCFHNKHVDTFAKALAEYNPIVMRGVVQKSIRQPLIDKFQENNGDYKIFIGNIKVISVGIDLDDKFGTWPRELWLIPNYYVIDQQQTIYRIKRMNTASVAKVNFLYIEDEENEGENPETRLITQMAKGPMLLGKFHPKQASIKMFPCDFEDEHWKRVYTVNRKEVKYIKDVRKSFYELNPDKMKEDLSPLLIDLKRQEKINNMSQTKTVDIFDLINEEYVDALLKEERKTISMSLTETNNGIDFMSIKNLLYGLSGESKIEPSQDKNKMVEKIYANWNSENSKQCIKVMKQICINKDYNSFLVMNENNKNYTFDLLCAMSMKYDSILVLESCLINNKNKLSLLGLFRYACNLRSNKYMKILVQYCVNLPIADEIYNYISINSNSERNEDQKFNLQLAFDMLDNCSDKKRINWKKLSRTINKDSNIEKVKLICVKCSSSTKNENKFLDKKDFIRLITNLIRYNFEDSAKYIMEKIKYINLSDELSKILIEIYNKNSFDKFIKIVKKIIDFLIDVKVDYKFISSETIIETFYKVNKEITEEQMTLFKYYLFKEQYFSDIYRVT